MRGATYYLATGAYGSYTFDDSTSGTQLITVRKATAADHGTSTGWQTAYGTGQATFGQWEIKSANWHFDGATGGGPGQWETGHGIRITGITRAAFVDENNDNVVYEHIEVNVGASGPSTSRAILIDTQNNVTFRYMWVHDIGCDVFQTWGGGTNLTIEYSKIARNYQNAACHGDLFETEAGNYTNRTIRWNYFEDVVGSYLFGSHDTASVNNFQIYGNIVHAKNTTMSTGNGTVGTLSAGGTLTNLAFCNNTIMGNWGTFGTVGFANPGSGSISGVARSNLWYRGSGSLNTSYTGVTQSHNTHYNNSGSGGENLAGNPFVSIGTNNAALIGPTTAGSTTGCPTENNVDMFGVERGADGRLDRGALEYTVGGPVGPAPPTNLRIVR